MSWDACLIDDRSHTEGSWNHTHNTNGMIAAAYQAAKGEAIEQCDDPLGAVIGPAWWDRLHGCAGHEGAEYLRDIIGELERDPDRYRAMNPENGWGSYDTLLPVLREMVATAERCEWPTQWAVHG